MKPDNMPRNSNSGHPLNRPTIHSGEPTNKQMQAHADHLPDNPLVTGLYLNLALKRLSEAEAKLDAVKRVATRINADGAWKDDGVRLLSIVGGPEPVNPGFDAKQWAEDHGETDV